MRLLVGLPVLWALPAFAALFAAIAIGAHTALRPFLPTPERLSEHHEVPGFLMGVVGVLYSVVLGFLVGTVWTAFSSAQQTVDLEAGYIADGFNVARELPSPQGKELQRLIARYAIATRDEDWSSSTWRDSDPTGALLYAAVRVAASVPTEAPNSSSAQLLETNDLRATEIVTLRQIADAERLRRVQAHSRLPNGLLEALILGAAAVIAFTFFFGVRSYAKQMVMTGLLAGSIGLFFGLVVELSMPYSGSVRVSRDTLNLMITDNHMEQAAR